MEDAKVKGRPLEGPRRWAKVKRSRALLSEALIGTRLNHEAVTYFSLAACQSWRTRPSALTVKSTVARASSISRSF